MVDGKALLHSIAEQQINLQTVQLHQAYFPYAIGAVIHAARTSIAFQNNVRNISKKPNPWLTYIAGFLIQSWTGGVLSSLLLGQYPPQLYSTDPWVVYISTHLGVTLLFHLFPSALYPPLFDTLLFPLDALIRLNSVTAALNAQRTHHDSRIAQSPLFSFILGAVASSGGGVTAGTLGAWGPDWSFSTPVFLRGTLLSTVDVWGGSVAAGLYGLLTSSYPNSDFILSKLHGEKPGAVLTPAEAKAIATVFLAVVFAWRVYALHWTAPAKKVLKKE